jgi:hypothetical protein
LAATACGDVSRSPSAEATPEAGTVTIHHDAGPTHVTPSDDAGSTVIVSAPDAGHDAGKPPAVDAGPDVDHGAPSTVYPAPHPAQPQVINVSGGVTLATPKVFLVFYPGYPYEQQLITMAKTFGASSQWAGSTSEYGVGPLAFAGSIELSGANATPPTSLTDSDVASFMNQQIASGAFGPPDTSTIYTIFYPETTTINLSGGGGTSCQDFGGYHDDFSVSFNQPLGDAGADASPDAQGPTLTGNFAFAVLPTCSTFGTLSGVDAVSGALSHEWVEASTDPFPSTNNGGDAAYASVDEDHVAWELLAGGGEVGDLCVPESNAFYQPSDFPFTVQRTWSNLLASQGHDPCSLNVPGLVYFNSAPVLNKTVSFNSQFIGGLVQTQGITIPVGKSGVIEVDLFSDGPTSGPWTVGAQDVLSLFNGQAPTLDLAFDKTEGVNGDKLYLTVTVVSASTDLGGAHPFVITSTLGQVQNTWPGFVVE